MTLVQESIVGYSSRLERPLSRVCYKRSSSTARYGFVGCVSRRKELMAENETQALTSLVLSDTGHERSRGVQITLLRVIYTINIKPTYIFLFPV